MPRIRQSDTPEYAVDVIDGARPVGSQLAIAAGILTVLLGAMSLAEAPMLRQDIHINEAESTRKPSPRTNRDFCARSAGRSKIG